MSEEHTTKDRDYISEKDQKRIAAQHTVQCVDGLSCKDQKRIAARLGGDHRSVPRYFEGRTGPAMTDRIEKALIELGLGKHVVRKIIVPVNRIGDFLPPGFDAAK